MSDKELMQHALDALIVYDGTNGESKRKRVLAALRERLAQPESEPVAWMWADGTVTVDPDRADGTWTPLYTEPRQWQGLTKDEVDGWELPDRPTVFEFAQFVEAKIKEKNNA